MLYQNLSWSCCVHIDFTFTIAAELTYVNLQLNPERYTGYTGPSARRIWDAIYMENCPKCMLLDSLFPFVLDFLSMDVSNLFKNYLLIWSFSIVQLFWFAEERYCMNISTHDLENWVSYWRMEGTDTSCVILFLQQESHNEL